MKKLLERIIKRGAFFWKKDTLNNKIHDVNYLVAHITTRPRRICSLITYRIVAVASEDQFADLERFVSNRKRYGQLNLDQKDEIRTISKQIIEDETTKQTLFTR